MRYKCVTCRIEFDTIEQLASHRRQHQASSGSSSGVTCLGCGKSIPLEPSKANYSGPITCPNCRRTMTVVIENGDVCVARLG
jgi:DNA-directed RNA polymerase subunit RPC12/RpoP